MINLAHFIRNAAFAAGFAAAVVVMLALGNVRPAYPDSYAPPSFTSRSVASLGGNCGSTSFVAQSGATTQCNLSGTGVFTALGVAVNASGGMTLLNGSIAAGHCIEWSAGGLQDAGAACSSFTPAGSSGSIQTNNGAGGLGSITPGTNVSTMLGNATNTAGGATTLFFKHSGSDDQMYPFWDVYSYSASSAYAAGTVYCGPFKQDESVHTDEIQVYIRTVGTSYINLALYSDAVDAQGRHYPSSPYNPTTTPQADTATGMRDVSNVDVGPHSCRRKLALLPDRRHHRRDGRASALYLDLDAPNWIPIRRRADRKRLLWRHTDIRFDLPELADKQRCRRHRNCHE